MPFDGIGFVATPTLTIWGRLSQFAKGFVPAPKVEPVRARFPTPGDQPDVQTVQVLTVARALIEDRKDWVQRRYETRDGRRCAVGALRGAARVLSLHGPQAQAHSILLGVAMGRGYSDIESMNDNSSHRQVLTAFDEAIARASAQCRAPA
jgi:hypothetical protein